MSNNKRERIIEAAAKSFSEHGFKGTTMDSVARIAKVGKGTVYVFFKNKEELFAEIVNRHIKQMVSVADEAFQEELPIHENIQNVIKAILDYRKNHSLQIKIIQEANAYKTFEVMEMMKKIDHDIIQYLTKLIKQQIDKGEEIKQDPELLAFLLFRTYTLLTVEWEKEHDSLQSGEITQVLQRLVY